MCTVGPSRRASCPADVGSFQTLHAVSTFSVVSLLLHADHLSCDIKHEPPDKTNLEPKTVQTVRFEELIWSGLEIVSGAVPLHAKG